MMDVMLYESVSDRTGKKASYPDFSTFSTELAHLSNSPKALAKPQYPYDRADSLKLSWDTNGLVGPFTIKSTATGRGAEDIESISFIAIDIDNADSAFDLIRSLEDPNTQTPLRKYNCIVYHTMRSKPSAPKLRLLMELDPASAVLPSEVRYLLDAVARLLNIVIDKQTKHSNRIHFLPIYPHNTPEEQPRTIYHNTTGTGFLYTLAEDPVAGAPVASPGLKYVTKDLEYTKGIDAKEAAFFFSRPAYTMSPEDLTLVVEAVEAYEKGVHPRLKYLLAPEGRQEWLEIAYALHHGFGGSEEGFTYWTRISKCDAARYKETAEHKGNDPRSIWESIDDTRPGGVTFSTFSKKYRVPMSLGSTAVKALVNDLNSVSSLSDLVDNNDELLRRIVQIPESGIRAVVTEDFLKGAGKAAGIAKGTLREQLRRVEKEVKTEGDAPERSERKHHNVLALLFEAIPRLEGLVYVSDKAMFYDIRANSRRPDPSRASPILWLSPEALASSVINSLKANRAMASVFEHEDYTTRAGTSIVDEKFLKTFLVQKLPTVSTARFIPYEGQIFTNNHGDPTLNLFHESLVAKPLARPLTDDEALAKRLIDGFVDLLLDGEPKYPTIYWDWVYDAAYNRLTRNPYILLVHGAAEGTGKSILRRLAMALVTMRYSGPTTGETLYEDKFNASIFDQRLINAVEEIHVPAKLRPNYTANVKHMLEDTVESHKKFEDKVTVDNFTAFFMTSNASDAIPIGITDRRHAVLRVARRLTDYERDGEALMEAVGRLVPGNIYTNLWHIINSGVYVDVFATLVYEKRAERPESWNSSDPECLETNAKKMMRGKTIGRDTMIVNCIVKAFKKGRLQNIPFVRAADVVRVLMKDYGQDIDFGFDENRLSDFNRRIGKIFSDVPSGILFDYEDEDEQYRVEVECPWEHRMTYTKVYGNLVMKTEGYLSNVFANRDILRAELTASLKALHQSMENEAGLHEVPSELALPPKVFKSKFINNGDEG